MLTQRTPVGIDPMAAPVMSLTNNSPLSAPPIDAVGASTDSPMRSSGSLGALGCGRLGREGQPVAARIAALVRDRKSTRLNSSHVRISYAVFCFEKKKA